MIRRRSVLGIVAGLVAAFGLVATAAPAPPAAAEPATTVGYPALASATRFSGFAFDACTAPSYQAMQAWTASPFRAVGVYIGGPNRSCTQANLTPSWVSAVSELRWRLIPIYMGRQAPCTHRANAAEFTAATAAAAGTSDAADAVTKATALGMLPGSAIYGDMEHYDDTDATCRTAVLRYVSSWTKELHRQGYLAGVYAHQNSGAKHLAANYASTSYARPDALWIARWDNSSSLTGWPNVANTLWFNHQRGKQYRGDHNETHGGVTINIDSDRFDAPVATVAYAHRAMSTTPLNGRSGPSTSYPVRATYAPGSTIYVVCQTRGSTVGTTPVWDKLTDGSYVTDYYVDTSSKTSYSAPLPRCTFPYQVLAGTYERTGPGQSYQIRRTLHSGALAWVSCQRAGSRVGTNPIWNRLDFGYYVPDYRVATPSGTTYSPPIPRC